MDILLKRPDLVIILRSSLPGPPAFNVDIVECHTMFNVLRGL
jgi:hypothetical protein